MNIKKVIMQSFVKLLMLQHMQCGDQSELESQLVDPLKQGNFEGLVKTLFAFNDRIKALEEKQDRMNQSAQEQSRIKLLEEKLEQLKRQLAKLQA